MKQSHEASRHNPTTNKQSCQATLKPLRHHACETTHCAYMQDKDPDDPKMPVWISPGFLLCLKCTNTATLARKKKIIIRLLKVDFFCIQNESDLSKSNLRRENYVSSIPRHPGCRATLLPRSERWGEHRKCNVILVRVSGGDDVGLRWFLEG